MGLEGTFNDYLDSWTAHCDRIPYEAGVQPYLDCDGYRGLIALGDCILPLLHRRIKDDQDFSLDMIPLLLEGIVGGDSFSVPSNIRGDVASCGEYAKSWLEEHFGKDASSSL